MAAISDPDDRCEKMVHAGRTPDYLIQISPRKKFSRGRLEDEWIASSEIVQFLSSSLSI